MKFVYPNTRFVQQHISMDVTKDPEPAGLHLLALDDALSDCSASCSPLLLSPRDITHNENAMSPIYDDDDDEFEMEAVTSPFANGLSLGVDYTNGTTVSTSVSVGTMSTRSRSRSRSSGSCISTMWRNFSYQTPCDVQREIVYEDTMENVNSNMKPIDSMSFKRVGFTINADIKEEDLGEKNYDLRVNAYHFCEYDSDETEEQFTEEEEEEKDDDDEKQEECGFLRTPPTLLIEETVDSKMDEFVVEKTSDVKAQNDEKDEEILMIPSLEVSYSMTRQATNERGIVVFSHSVSPLHYVSLYFSPSDH